MDYDSDVCADCTALSPQWASINRGVLLCDECSSVHRQLGRHISQIKHLHKSRWRPSQLAMVRYLAAACANRYWEHVLYEPMLAGQHQVQKLAEGKQVTTSGQATPRAMSVTLTKKPKPNDPMHPNKTEFIREKYLFLGFFKKPRNVNLDDLNHQLHASVRTGVLETSLYLLALGANPNFIHPTKGTSPMHVACQYAQVGQVEVLLAYGADVCIRDSSGHTPVDVALDRAMTDAETAGTLSTTGGLFSIEQRLPHAWSPLVDALVNAYYEVTDSLAYFLSRCVPNHKSALFHTSDTTTHNKNGSPNSLTNGHNEPSAQCRPISSENGHFLIATAVLQAIRKSSTNGPGSGGPISDQLMLDARDKLGQLPNLAFEDLCVDVYDEADRRLTNSFLESSASPPPMIESRLNGHRDLGKISGSTTPTTVPQKTSTPGGARSLTLYFLPPNTAYSSVRNQARQKLGRLSTVEFHTLVLDILTEVSARLLPLFPPLANFAPSSPITPPLPRPPLLPCRHESTVSSLRTVTDGPVDVCRSSTTVGSSRTAPLPSPPVADDDAVNAAAAVRASTTSPVPTHVSSCASSEPSQSPQDVTVASSGDHSNSLGKLNGGGSSRAHIADDPVYDQVAFDSDLLNSLSTNHVGSALPQSPTLSSCTTQPPNGIAADIVEQLSDPNSTASTSIIGVEIPSPTAPSDSQQYITSLPGPLPGSRRLHLTHTSRITPYRASVPAAQPWHGRMVCDYPLSPVLEAANLATPEHSMRQYAQQPVDNTDRSATTTTPQLKTGPPVGVVEPCCVAARNEVNRLRRENTDLLHQVTDLQSAKQVVETRLKSLEGRMEQVDRMMETLKEEKSALLAAFSAGMVMTHSSPGKQPASSNNLTPTTRTATHEIVSSPLRVAVPCSSSSATDRSRVQELHSPYDEEILDSPGNQIDSTAIVGAVDDVNDDDDDEEDYGDERSERSNYAIGSHSMDTGIRLHQGIILRSSGPSRGGDSPPNTKVTGVGSGQPASPLVRNDHHRIPSSNPRGTTATTTYVNMIQPQPHLYPKPSLNLLDGKRGLVTPQQYVARTSTAPVCHTDADYCAPNSTGTDSPAPHLTASSGTTPTTSTTSISDSPRAVNLAGAVPVLPMGGGGEHWRMQHRQQELQQQHAQILASIATLPDYDVPTPPSRNTRIQQGHVTQPLGPVTNAGSRETGSAAGSAGWFGPKSDRVVRCVEAIIAQIRHLIQLANGERGGDFVNCSRLIQAVVDDILRLFPPASVCPSQVAGALTHLAAATQHLQPHCEQLAQRWHSLPAVQRIPTTVGGGVAPTPPPGAVPTRILAPEVSDLIRDAQQIAKAAKDLLSLIQQHHQRTPS